MPFYFFRRKIWRFILLSLILITAGTLFKHSIEFSRMQKMMIKRWNETNVIFPEDQKLNGSEINKPYMPFEKGDMPPPDLSEGKSRDLLPPFRKPPFRIDFISFYTILLIYLGGVSIRFIGKWNDDEKRKSEIEKEKIATELSFLKQQINPHFLFNSLNSIYSLTISKSDKAVDSILKLSSILRYMLYESGASHVSLRDELQIVNDYIELQKLRITEKVNLVYKMEGTPASYKIEPFIIVPLIENAFKYGVDNYNSSTINILIEIKEDMLLLRLKNTIVKSSDILSGEGGIGIKNIKRRLDLLYPGDYTFDIDKTGELFSVILELKLKE
jgi:sensor histidine kinase YesM